jgi:hypothetical protein
MENKNDLKVISASIKNGDTTKVKVQFSKTPFSPEEFTCVFMGILESYTEALLHNNPREAVYEHFNNAFGIFLNKILPEDKIYEVSKAHKEFKKTVDDTLSKPEDEATKADNAANKVAAYLLAREILINDAGLDEATADVLLNKKLKGIKEIDLRATETKEVQ